MKMHAFRLKTGDLLREEIDKFVLRKKIKAGVILACVGHLTKAVLRMSDDRIVKTFVGRYEIVSITGTLEEGNSHIHVSISDETGQTWGGHLKMGSIVGITAEIVIAELPQLKFGRKFDEVTGFEELIVSSI